MLGVDTNVLVRFLADDDDVQTPAATRLLMNSANHPIYVSALVFAETYTVLTRVKKFPEDSVRDAMWLLLDSSDFMVEAADMIARALQDSAQAGCGLVDAMIAAKNNLAGCEATATFDRRAQRLPTAIPVEDRT